jgi:hypothetical protein
MSPPSLLVAPLVIALAAAPAGAQHLVLSGAVQRDVQQFPGSEVPARLDGSATGWMVGAAVPLPRRLALAVEWSDGGTIEDRRAVTFDFERRTIAVMSSFRHHTRTVGAFIGYRHVLSSRVRVSPLVGVGFTTVERRFASNAPGLLLLRPSDSSTSESAALVNRFRAMTGGADGSVRISGRFQVTAGVRAQKLGLPPDASGWSIRTFIGAGWDL